MLGSIEKALLHQDGTHTHKHTHRHAGTYLGQGLVELDILFLLDIAGAAQPDGFIVIQQLPPPSGLLLRLGLCSFLLIFVFCTGAGELNMVMR